MVFVLDTSDMERHAVELRLSLAKAKRRFMKAQMEDTYEKIVKNMLPEGNELQEQNVLRIDALASNDEARRLSDFLNKLVDRCNRIDQHEMLQQALRQSLQQSRRKSIIDPQTGEQLEPMCLFCASDLSGTAASGCTQANRHQAQADGSLDQVREQFFQPIGFSASGRSTADSGQQPSEEPEDNHYDPPEDQQPQAQEPNSRPQVQTEINGRGARQNNGIAPLSDHQQNGISSVPVLKNSATAAAQSQEEERDPSLAHQFLTVQLSHSNCDLTPPPSTTNTPDCQFLPRVQAQVTQAPAASHQSAAAQPQPQRKKQRNNNKRSKDQQPETQQPPRASSWRLVPLDASSCSQPSLRLRPPPPLTPPLPDSEGRTHVRGFSVGSSSQPARAGSAATLAVASSSNASESTRSQQQQTMSFVPYVPSSQTGAAAAGSQDGDGMDDSLTGWLEDLNEKDPIEPRSSTPVNNGRGSDADGDSLKAKLSAKYFESKVVTVSAGRRSSSQSTSSSAQNFITVKLNSQHAKASKRMRKN